MADVEIKEMAVADLFEVARQFVQLHTMFADDQFRPVSDLLTASLVHMYLVFPGKESRVYIACWRGDPPLPHNPSKSEGQGVSVPAAPARDDYTIAGFIQVSIRSNLSFNRPISVGEVDNLWVEEPWRGSGVASMLLTHGEQWLRESSVDLIELYVHVANEAATRFYIKSGYEQQHVVMRKKTPKESADHGQG